MKKAKLRKRRRFKYRLIGYASIMLLGYELTYNTIMNFKLVNNNELFVKALLIDSNYHMLYEKKASNILTKAFSKILNVNEPVTLLDNIFHMKESSQKTSMAYVNNPNI